MQYKAPSVFKITKGSTECYHRMKNKVSFKMYRVNENKKRPRAHILRTCTMYDKKALNAWQKYIYVLVINIYHCPIHSQGSRGEQIPSWPYQLLHVKILNRNRLENAVTTYNSRNFAILLLPYKSRTKTIGLHLMCPNPKKTRKNNLYTIYHNSGMQSTNRLISSSYMCTK